MKVHSLISATMHGYRLAARAAVVLGCGLGMNSCMSLTAKKHTYAATSNAVRVNGADIRMQVKPEGTSGGNFAVSAMVVSAAVATFDGPFRWRIEATGVSGQHRALVIHRIRTRTEKTRRDEWYPTTHLGKRADFRQSKKPPGSTRAVYPIPGLLVVKPREDGPLSVTVDLSVTCAARTERKLVQFRMEPSQKRQDEFIFVPTEIINNIGKSPADWDQSGWD